MARRPDALALSTNSTIYFCEDHFDYFYIKHSEGKSLGLRSVRRGAGAAGARAQLRAVSFRHCGRTENSPAEIAYGCGWESLMKGVTLGNVTMSHRTREARRMPSPTQL
ncbi:hypothetical protein EVAR_18144_1 [Eumeta japonica]|uniref:Uncharacterized protein n=1 Tax=Eumeta variegata TaxID=151549 RepID=A0A4C1UV83_EUMVA|nr:hypothetical protein EVAR_18144_1 [Eumeta japonica]